VTSALHFSGSVQLPDSLFSDIDTCIRSALVPIYDELLQIKESLSNLSSQKVSTCLCYCSSGISGASSIEKIYYVSPNGDDRSYVTYGVTFQSIQRAIDVAMPGDTIFVSAGIYHERLQMRRSGLSGQPITLIGETNVDERPLVTIDGSDDVPSWQPAPEVGAGVYKTNTIPYVPWTMIVDNGREVWRIANKWMDGESADIFGGNGGYPVINGKGVLALPESQFVYPYGSGKSIPFWDGIDALFGYIDGYTYVRFRHGDDPVTRHVRVSPGPFSQFSFPRGACITLKNVSFIKVQGFRMCGARNAVLIMGTDSYNNSTNNMIDECCLMNGNMRVRFSGAAHNNLIINNYMEKHSLGIDRFLPPRENVGGAWPSREHQRHLYNIDKFLVSGVGGEDDRHIGIHSDGTGVVPRGNIIQGNEMYGAAQAINTGEHDDTIFAENLCYGHFSQHIFMNGPNKNFHIRHNSFYTPGQYQMRSNDVNKSGAVYVYRNRFWIPDTRGEHFFFGLLGGITGDSVMEIWIYHNSIAGGVAAFIHNFASGFGPASLRVLNNIFSTNAVIFNGYPTKMGLYDYNWGYRDSVDKPWSGTHNILGISQMWSPSSLPDFIINQSVLDGIDVSKTFTVQMKTFSALPGMISGHKTILGYF